MCCQPRPRSSSPGFSVRPTRYYRLPASARPQRFFMPWKHLSWLIATMERAMFPIIRMAGDERGRAGQHISPGQRTRFSPHAAAVALQHPSRHGFDVPREFWPEISRHSSCPSAVKPSRRATTRICHQVSPCGHTARSPPPKKGRRHSIHGVLLRPFLSPGMKPCIHSLALGIRPAPVVCS